MPEALEGGGYPSHPKGKSHFQKYLKVAFSILKLIEIVIASRL